MLDDKLLVWKFNRGSINALSRIYEKYRDDLLRLAAALLNDIGDVEEQLQVAKHIISSQPRVIDLAVQGIGNLDWHRLSVQPVYRIEERLLKIGVSFIAGGVGRALG